MIRYLIILLGLLFASCSTETNTTDKKSDPQDNISVEPIIQERIDGPANIRDTINGEIVFKLYDNVLIECTQLENGWYIIAIDPTNPAEDYRDNFIKKGTKILVNNQVVGETVQDAEVTLGLNGYTHKDNIKSETIIELVLTEHIKSISPDRTILDFTPIIDKFQLDKDDQFEGYTVYYNYENWIDDPSPMMRIGLVFKDNKLVAILHSRPLDIKNTTDNKLDRGFDCLTYNDIVNTDDIVKMFNNFVNSVD